MSKTYVIFIFILDKRSVIFCYLMFDGYIMRLQKPQVDYNAVATANQKCPFTILIGNKRFTFSAHYRL